MRTQGMSTLTWWILLAASAGTAGCASSVVIEATGSAGGTGGGGAAASAVGSGGATTASSSDATSSTTGNGGTGSGGNGSGGNGGGGGGTCPGGPCWMKRFGSGREVSRAVGFDSAHNIIVMGEFVDALDFGGGPLPILGRADLFVAALDVSGRHLWSRSFGSPENITDGQALAIDPAGSLIIGGSTDRVIDFGGGPRCVSFAQQGFVLKLDAGGRHVFSNCFGDLNGEIFEPLNMAADASGNTFIAGRFSGIVDFGGGPLDSSAGALFVGKLDPAGHLVWIETYGGPGGAADIRSMAGADGDLLLTGDLYGTIDFGGGPLRSGAVGVAPSNVFMARLGSSGDHIWSKVFASRGEQHGLGIAVDPAGRVAVTGGMKDTVDFGGGPLTSVGYDDIYLASFDTAGNPLWSRRFGGPNADIGRTLGYDGTGNVVLVAEPGSDLDFGGGATVGRLSGFALVRFDPAGNFIDQRYTDEALVTGMAMSGGQIALTGQPREATVDLGFGPITGPSNDVFVGVLSP